MRIRDFSKVELLVFILTLLLVFIMAARTPLDSDMWWHLRAGEQTWSDGVPLRVDLFSHTRYGEKWINHSWLAQVGMYLLFRWQGFLALGGMTALLATLSMEIIYLQMDGPALLKAGLVILGSLVAAVIWAPRPQMFSFFLLSLVLYLLQLYRRGGKNYLWLFLPLFVLWSNLHAGYTLGLMVIGLTTLGEILNHLLDPESEEGLPWKNIFQLAGWGVAAGLAVLVNPNGVDTWLIPFQTVNVEALQQFVVEWASPDFHEVTQQPFLWLLCMVMASWAFSRKKVDGADALMVICFAYLSLVARRNFGPFGLVTLPVLSRQLLPAAEPFVSWLKKRVEADGRWAKFLNKPVEEAEASQPLFKRIINLSLVGLLSLVAAGKLVAVTHPALMKAYLSEQYPVQAVESIEVLNLPGNLLNEYNWGGFLTWQLRNYPVFVDGRTDLYGDEVIDQWIDLVNGVPGWEDELKDANIRWILLEPGRPLVPRLEDDPDWELVYKDEKAVVYRWVQG